MPRVADIRLPLPQFSAGHVHQLAKRILAEPQFRQPAKPWLVRLGDWLTRQLDRLLNALTSGGSAGVVAWILVAVVVGAAAYLVMRFSRRVQRDPGIRVERAPAERRSASDWESLAAAHREAARWKDAIRCGYRALIASLAESKVVEEVPGRTAREYERIIGRNLPGAVKDFGDATELFEQVWYGDRETGSSEDQEFQALRRQVGRAAQAASR